MGLASVAPILKSAVTPVNLRKPSNNAPEILSETHETPFFGSI